MSLLFKSTCTKSETKRKPQILSFTCESEHFGDGRGSSALVTGVNVEPIGSSWVRIIILRFVLRRQTYSCEWVEVRNHRFVLRSHRTTQPTMFSWSNWCVTVGTSFRLCVRISSPSATASSSSTKESTIVLTAMAIKIALKYAQN